MLQERFLPSREIQGEKIPALSAVTRLLRSLNSALPIRFALLRLCNLAILKNSVNFVPVKIIART